MPWVPSISSVAVSGPGHCTQIFGDGFLWVFHQLLNQCLAVLNGTYGQCQTLSLNPHLTLPFFNTVGWVNVELHLMIVVGSHVRFLINGGYPKPCRTKPELAVEQYSIP